MGPVKRDTQSLDYGVDDSILCSCDPNDVYRDPSSLAARNPKPSSVAPRPRTRMATDQMMAQAGSSRV